jgi:hypothetical protein
MSLDVVDKPTVGQQADGVQRMASAPRGGSSSEQAWPVGST